MKIATITVRVLIGALLLFSSTGFFLKLLPEPEYNGSFKAFNVGLMAATYLIPLAKSIEFLCGLSYVSGKYVSLANIVVLPITVNILFINYFLSPKGLPLATLLFLGNIFLIYRYWKNYKSLFKP